MTTNHDHDDDVLELAPCSRDEAEEADLVVCTDQSYFADDIWTVCARCSTPIVHRPYMPVRPPKICLPCARALVSAIPKTQLN